MNKIIKEARAFAKRFRVANGKKFRLKDIDPEDTLHLNEEDTINNAVPNSWRRERR